DDGRTEVILCEIGGTVGDIEGLVFLEAIRQIGLEAGPENVMYVHLTYVPFIRAAGEIKTKPTQQSVAKLREIGIIPDALICRTERPLSDAIRRKLSLFCNVPQNAVFQEQDVRCTIYEVPLRLSEQGMDELILVHFRLARPPARLDDWRRLVRILSRPKGKVRIAVVGKYSELQDAYKSIYEAIVHGGLAHEVGVEILKVAAEDVEAGRARADLEQAGGILVPGGFGQRGIQGKIEAVRIAREKRIPFLGICLGLQCAVIEFARNVLGLQGAHSTEMEPGTPEPVISLMEEQKKVKRMGGTMRLGAWRRRLKPGSRAAQAYRTEEVRERHRHRYELNNTYRVQMERAGMVMSGVNPELDLVEIIELQDHPWFVATQFHPEFKSRPREPHPLFRDFVGAALERSGG
ncbi:MAG TPA: CTP synthase, partial [Kiritimatiellae bacterium]|nr:CTP synthase [Kiritimatiellia bacterium]